MNVFVLNTGRCGSTTFIEACKHISNFSAGHETRTAHLGDAHLDYPANHIEADNRLSWFLGRLDRSYGNKALYVHLTRDTAETAKSFTKRYSYGIIQAYRSAILLDLPEDADPMAVSLDYCETINSNIELFLKDKTYRMSFSLENAHKDFRTFWAAIGAEGDLNAALKEWDVPHNSASENLQFPNTQTKTRNGRLVNVLRTVKRLPSTLRQAGNSATKVVANTQPTICTARDVGDPPVWDI